MTGSAERSERTTPIEGHMQREDNEQWGARLAAGDAGAWAEVEAAYRGDLVRFALGYLGDVAAAEDAAQETFVRALSSGSAPEAVRPWLYRIARNLCLNTLRSRRVRSEERLPTRAPFHESVVGHLTRLVAREDVHGLREELERLSLEHREVLGLRYGEDLSRAEIAEVLDLAPSVVKSRLYEATKVLRDRAGRQA